MPEIAQSTDVDVATDAVVADGIPPNDPSGILVIPKKKKRRVVTTGDVHGKKELFQQMVKDLPYGAIALASGDLVDRGPDSWGVVQLILENRRLHKEYEEYKRLHPEAKDIPAQYNIPEIHSTRGNHEDIFLTVFAGIMPHTVKAASLADGKHDDSKRDSDDDDVLVVIDDKTLANRKEKYQKLLGDSGKWVADLSREQLKQTYALFASLPTIISLRDEVGLPERHIVHADMPISDAELERRIAANKGLTPAEKEYATNAREQSREPKYTINPVLHKRTKDSTLTFVGNTSPDDPGYRAVREQSNTVNLDVGNDALMAVEESDEGCSVKLFTNEKLSAFDSNRDTNSKKVARLAELDRTRHKIEQHVLTERVTAKQAAEEAVKVDARLQVAAQAAHRSEAASTLKQLYLAELEREIPKLNPCVKKALARYLLSTAKDNREHLLTQDNNSFRRISNYLSNLWNYFELNNNTHQTRSMHKAVRMLVGDDSDIAKIDAQNKQVVLTFKDEDDEKPVSAREEKRESVPVETFVLARHFKDEFQSAPTLKR